MLRRLAVRLPVTAPGGDATFLDFLEVFFGKKHRHAATISGITTNFAGARPAWITEAMSPREPNSPARVGRMAEANHKTTLGDEEFVSRMTACQRDLRTFLLGLTPSRADADDMLQEVNLALWRKRAQYDPSQNFLRWAFGFAALEARSFRSKAAKGKLWFDDDTIESLAGDWQQSNPFRDDLQHALVQCLKKLGEVERAVVEAKYRSQASVKQIAEDSGRPVSTVYKILTRALVSLRSCVKRSQEGDFTTGMEKGRG